MLVQCGEEERLSYRKLIHDKVKSASDELGLATSKTSRTWSPG